MLCTRFFVQKYWIFYLHTNKKFVAAGVEQNGAQKLTTEQFYVVGLPVYT
jgi:hypothetical protein